VEHPKLVKWLLGKGADPSIVSPSGDTPLSFAVTQAPIESIELLISSYKRYSQDLSPGDLVWLAVRRYGKDQNLEHLRILEMLIRAGAPVDNAFWDQPPAYTTRQQYLRGTPLHEACMYGYADVAAMLLANGANLHKKQTRYGCDEGETPYEIAAAKNDTVMLGVMQRHVCDQS
jgi:ankyrin repeat protein